MKISEHDLEPRAGPWEEGRALGRGQGPGKRAGPWEEGRALGERASPIALGDAHGKRWRALPGR